MQRAFLPGASKPFDDFVLSTKHSQIYIPTPNLFLGIWLHSGGGGVQPVERPSTTMTTQTLDLLHQAVLLCRAQPREEGQPVCVGGGGSGGSSTTTYMTPSGRSDLQSRLV